MTAGRLQLGRVLGLTKKVAECDLGCVHPVPSTCQAGRHAGRVVCEMPPSLAGGPGPGGWSRGAVALVWRSRVSAGRLSAGRTGHHTGDRGWDTCPVSERGRDPGSLDACTRGGNEATGDEHCQGLRGASRASCLPRAGHDAHACPQGLVSPANPSPPLFSTLHLTWMGQLWPALVRPSGVGPAAGSLRLTGSGPPLPQLQGHQVATVPHPWLWPGALPWKPGAAFQVV